MGAGNTGTLTLLAAGDIAHCRRSWAKRQLYRLLGRDPHGVRYRMSRFQGGQDSFGAGQRVEGRQRVLIRTSGILDAIGRFQQPQPVPIGGSSRRC